LPGRLLLGRTATATRELGSTVYRCNLQQMCWQQMIRRSVTGLPWWWLLRRIVTVIGTLAARHCRQLRRLPRRSENAIGTLGTGRCSSCNQSRTWRALTIGSSWPPFCDRLGQRSGLMEYESSADVCAHRSMLLHKETGSLLISNITVGMAFMQCCPDALPCLLPENRCNPMCVLFVATTNDIHIIIIISGPIPSQQLAELDVLVSAPMEAC
jgi:hypothetical protein